jgi:hypothetical protein
MRNRDNNTGEYIMFLLFPFYTFIKSIINYNRNYSKTIFILFLGFYGYMITTPKKEVDMDIFRRIDLFESFAKGEEKFSFNVFLLNLNDDGSYATDPFESLMMSLISKITDNYRILFLIYGILFGILFTKNVWYILEKFNITIGKNNIIFFLLLFLIIPFWNITIFRFYFASQIFIFGAIRFLYTKKYYYILFCLISTFVHFSFSFALISIIIFFLLSNKIYLSYSFLIMSLFIGNLDINSITDKFNIFPKAYENKIQGYTNDEYSVEVAGNKSLVSNRWYLNGKNISIKIAFLLLYLLIFFKIKILLKNEQFSRFLSFALIFFSMALLVNNIPSMDRFYTLAYFFGAIIGLIVFFKDKELNVLPLKFNNIFFLLIGLYLIVEIRIGMDTFGLLTFIGNPFFIFFANQNISVIDLVKLDF